MIKYNLPDRKLCMAVTEALSGLLSSSSKASSEVTTEDHCTYIHLNLLWELYVMG